MNPPSERRFPRIPLAKAQAGASPGAAAFLEDLIDACVMEIIHVWRRGLKPLCGGQGNAFAWLVQSGCKPLLHLNQTLNAPSHGERLKYEGRMMKWGNLSDAFSSFIHHPSSFLFLLRLTADSPDLLAVIKAEGKV